MPISRESIGRRGLDTLCIETACTARGRVHWEELVVARCRQASWRTDAGSRRYPITLTTLHLLYQTVATRLLHRYTDLVAPPVSSGRYTLLPMSEKGGEAISPDLVEEDRRKAKAASVEMDWSSWRNQIVPPAVMFSISLVLSNWVYLYLTTAFIHMLSASLP